MRARQSGRQRKQRQFGDEMWDDEMLSGEGAACTHCCGHPSAGCTAETLPWQNMIIQRSITFVPCCCADDGDYEYNEDAEAPYFAPIAAPEQPKQPRKKKQKVGAGSAGLGGEAQQQYALPALPDDFAAALAAATMVQQQPAPSAGAPGQPAASGPGGSAGGQQQQPQQEFDEQVPQDVQQPAAKPKLKIKLGGACAAPQPQREPSRKFHLLLPPCSSNWQQLHILSFDPALCRWNKMSQVAPKCCVHLCAYPPCAADFVYDYTVGEEEEQHDERRPGKAKGALCSGWQLSTTEHLGGG